jgi:DNA-binding CsgD family transcriptional regulator
MHRMSTIVTRSRATTTPALSRPHGGRVRLTRREFEVLRLLAEGQTDREIADALLLSTRTVSSHVAHILAEVGVARRTAAAVWAVRTGLI